MNLFGNDDEILVKFENIKEPMLMPNSPNISHKIRFLKEIMGLKYSWDWYLSDTRRACAIYSQQYPKYLLEFSEKTKEYLLLETKARMIRNHRRINREVK